MSNALRIDSFGSRSRRNRITASTQCEGSAPSFAQRSASSACNRDPMPAFAARVTDDHIESQPAARARKSRRSKAGSSLKSIGSCRSIGVILADYRWRRCFRPVKAQKTIRRQWRRPLDRKFYRKRRRSVTTSSPGARRSGEISSLSLRPSLTAATGDSLALRGTNSAIARYKSHAIPGLPWEKGAVRRHTMTTLSPENLLMLGEGASGVCGWTN